jgi:hypothetical protein
LELPVYSTTEPDCSTTADVSSSIFLSANRNIPTAVGQIDEESSSVFIEEIQDDDEVFSHPDLNTSTNHFVIDNCHTDPLAQSYRVSTAKVIY